jgi:hypothetical protein
MLDIISHLDLSTIKAKIIRDGLMPDTKSLDLAEQEYKEFLQLCFDNKKESIGISKEADIFWHHHILDTKKYMSDCDNIFGYFLHHNPNLLEGSVELEAVARYTAGLKNIPFKLNEYTFCGAAD